MKRRQCTPPAPVDESYDFGQWRLTTRKRHILPSLCAKGSCQELVKPKTNIITVTHLSFIVISTSHLFMVYGAHTKTLYMDLFLTLQYKNEELVSV